jgi:adenine-specific DNA glycosylase
VEYWGDINLLLVGFGQQVCTPQNPRCQQCAARTTCPTGQTNIKLINAGKAMIRQTKEEMRKKALTGKRKTIMKIELEELEGSAIKQEFNEAAVKVQLDRGKNSAEIVSHIKQEPGISTETVLEEEIYTGAKRRRLQSAHNNNHNNNNSTDTAATVKSKYF